MRKDESHTNAETRPLGSGKPTPAQNRRPFLDGLRRFASNFGLPLPYGRVSAFLLLLLVLTSGCRWNPFKQGTLNPSPVLFTNMTPTLQELELARNAEVDRVTRISSSGAVVRVPGAPPINASIDYQRPLGFRFRAGTTLTGPEADFGSNDEVFWFWVARSPQPALFFARHDQFARSAARAQLPVDPTWLVDAIGLTRIDPQLVWEGPTAVADDRVEVRTKVPSGVGELTRTITIHNRFGWVLQQQLTDSRGQVVASSTTSNHQHYPADGVSLPQRIDVNIPTLGSFALDVDRWQVNSLSADPQQLFALPREQLQSYPLVDLANPNGSNPPASVPVNAPTNGPYGPPAAGVYGPSSPVPRVSTQVDPREGIRGFNNLR